jgi:hypothetical protein
MVKFVKKLARLGGFVFLCFLVLILLPAQSQARRPSQKVTPPLAKVAQTEHSTRYIRHGLDINDFRVPMTNYAPFGQFIDLGSAGGEWPKGSNEFYIYGAGIWVGGTVNDRTLQTFNFADTASTRDQTLYGTITDPRVVIGYNPSGGAEEFSGLTDIFISDHPEDYDDPDFWPLRDDEGNPVIVGIEDSYCEFDDQDVERWDTGINSNAGDGVDIAKYGLGVKVIQRTHSWNYENNKTIHFFIYQIVNIREDRAPIRNCYVSIMCDADVGPTANDDKVGFDASRNLGYAFDSDFAEQGFARIPGYLAYKFLESPVANYDVDLNGNDMIDDDSVEWNGVLVKDVRKGSPLGLTSFKTSNLQSGDPDTEPEKYIIMAGHEYPDVGDQRYAPFDLGTGDTPQDQRFFQSTGPFLLVAVGDTIIDTVWAWDSAGDSLRMASKDTVVGDTVRVVVAVLMAPDAEQLPVIADIAQSIYDIGFVLPRPPDHPGITIVPDDKKVYITWDDAAELSKDPYYKFTSDPENALYDPLYREADFEGYEVYRSTSGLPGTFSLLASWDKSSVTPRHVDIKQVSGPQFEGIAYDEFWTENWFLRYGGTALFTGQEYLVQVKADGSFFVSNLTLGVDIPTVDHDSLAEHWYFYGEPPYVFEVFSWGINPVFSENDEDSLPTSRSTAERIADGTDDDYFDNCWLLVGGMAIHFSGDAPGDEVVFRITGHAQEPEGDNTELAHAYLDTGLINGVTYYYDVIAYDFQPFASPRSLANGIRGIAVTPRSNVSGLSAASAYDVQHPSGGSDGSVTVDVVNPLKVTGHDYKVIFDDSTYSQTVWHLIDVTDGDTVLKDQANQAGDDDYLVVDGLLVRVVGPAFGVKSVAEVANAAGPVDPPDNLNYSLNSTKDWYMDPGEGAALSRYSWNGATTHDYEIRFVEAATEYCWDWFGTPDGNYSFVAPFQVPIEFWDLGIGTVDDPSDDVRITFMIIDDDGSNSFSWGDGLYIRDMPYDDVAWTTPGISSDAYVSDFSDLHYGRFWFYDYSGELTRPDAGTVVRVLTNKVSTSADVFTFKTTAATISSDQVNLDDVRVVPNPYIVRNAWEPSRDYSRIAFTHLPDKCTIRIYTLSGDHLQTLEHESPTFDGNENWDLLTKNSQKIAAGVYIYHVDSEYGEKIGKFAVVR